MTYLKYIFFITIIGLTFACNSTPKDNPTNNKAEEKPIATAEDKSKVQNYTTHNVSWKEINSLEKVPFDFMVPYGEEELQFGELRTPLTQDTFPLVIFLHGGCWLSAYNLEYLSAAAGDLVEEGYAVWTPEYRRVGDEAGGYPNTFKDVQASVDFSRTLAEIYPLDTNNVVIMGHSAGGHLALWLAGQGNLATNSSLHNPNPLPLKGVISLAGITDLVAYDKIGNDCSTAVVELMGGKAAEKEVRYRTSSPIHLLPSNIPIRLIQGEVDNIVPMSQGDAYAAKAKAAGVDVKVVTIKGGGHFDMASPYSAAWKAIKTELAELID